MDECEKILDALVQDDKNTQASELAIWLGDKWIEYNNLVRAEADFKIAYDKSDVKKDKYDTFVAHQK